MAEQRLDRSVLETVRIPVVCEYPGFGDSLGQKSEWVRTNAASCMATQPTRWGLLERSRTSRGWCRVRRSRGHTSWRTLAHLVPCIFSSRLVPIQGLHRGCVPRTPRASGSPPLNEDPKLLEPACVEICLARAPGCLPSRARFQRLPFLAPLFSSICVSTCFDTQDLFLADGHFSVTLVAVVIIVAHIMVLQMTELRRLSTEQMQGRSWGNQCDGDLGWSLIFCNMKGSTRHTTKSTKCCPFPAPNCPPAQPWGNVHQARQEERDKASCRVVRV